MEKLLVDDKVTKIYRNGEVHVHQYQGVQLSRFDIKKQSQNISQQGTAATKEELAREIQLAGERLNAMKTYDKARFEGMVSIAPQAAVLPHSVIEGVISLDEEDPSWAKLTELVEDELAVLISLEEESQAAWAAIEEQEKLELSIFIAENKHTLEKMQRLAENKNVGKMKLMAELRVTGAVTLVTSSAIDLKTEHNKVIEKAKEMFGKNDWDGFPGVKEQVQKADENLSQVDNSVGEFEQWCQTELKTLRTSQKYTC